MSSANRGRFIYYSCTSACFLPSDCMDYYLHTILDISGNGGLASFVTALSGNPSSISLLSKEIAIPYYFPDSFYEEWVFSFAKAILQHI